MRVYRQGLGLRAGVELRAVRQAERERMGILDGILGLLVRYRRGGFFLEALMLHGCVMGDNNSCDCSFSTGVSQSYPNTILNRDPITPLKISRIH